MMRVESIDSADQDVCICQAVHRASLIARSAIDTVATDSLMSESCLSFVWEGSRPGLKSIGALLPRYVTRRST